MEVSVFSHSFVINSCCPQAIIHYKPDPNDCDIIKKDQIYLCDSGGVCGLLHLM